MQKEINCIVLFFVIIGHYNVIGGINYHKYGYIWGNTVEVNYTFVIENCNMRNKVYARGPNKNDLLYKVIKVQTFYIHHTRNTFIPENYTIFFTNLKSLRVEKTDFHHVTANSMKNLQGIQNLYLGKNKINVIDFDAFDILTNLKQLYLNGNKISLLNDLTFFKLQKLEMIMLDDNNLKNINSRLFSKNINLKRIYLANNQISIIEPLFFDHPSLKNCDMTGNICTNMKTGWYNLQDMKIHAEKCCQVHNSIECVPSYGNELISLESIPH